MQKSTLRQAIEVIGGTIFVGAAIVGAVFASALGVLEPKLDIGAIGATIDQDTPSDEDGNPAALVTFEVINTGGIDLTLSSFGPGVAPGLAQITEPEAIGPLAVTQDETVTVDVLFHVDCDELADVRWDPELSVDGFFPLNKIAVIDLGRAEVPGFTVTSIDGRGDDNPRLQERYLGIVRASVCSDLK